MNTYKIITDAAVKNVGEAIRYRGTAGVLILNEDDQVVKFDSFTLGKVTNNEGEYEALRRGIIILNEHIIKVVKGDNTPLYTTLANAKMNTSVELYTDSNLVYNQLLGNFKVKKVRLLDKVKDIKAVAKGYKHIKVNWHKRDQPLAQLADFASKHTKKTKALNQSLMGTHVGNLTTKVDTYLEKHACKLQAEEHEGVPSES